MEARRLAKRRPPRVELTDEQKKEIRDAFDLFDSNRDGAVDVHELKVSLRALGFDIKKEEARQILKDNQRNGSGLIEFPEFLEIGRFYRWSDYLFKFLWFHVLIMQSNCSHFKKGSNGRDAKSF